MSDICFWSVGDGEYAYMLQALVDSFRAVGMQEDFHVFSDRKIPGAKTHLVEKFDKRGCFFKLHFLQKQVKEWNYRYFVYLDADTLFLRPPPFPILEVMQDSPLHFSFECDCTLPPMKRYDWWGCPLHEYVQLMRNCGVTSDKVYNVNGGFFIIEREAIDIVCELALDFAKYATQEGYLLPDEPAWAYAMHMLCDEPEKHLLSRYWDLWCSDWEGVFSKCLPIGKPWVFKDYMSEEPHVVNPAIVHAIKSKDLLIERGKSFLMHE